RASPTTLPPSSTIPVTTSTSGGATPPPPPPPTGHPRRPDPHTDCAGEARARTAVRPTHPYAPAARGERRRSPRHPPPVTRAGLTRTPFARAKPALERRFVAPIL